MLKLTVDVDTLQMLGCIPRTPSPEPEDTPIDTTANEREARVQALRVSLLQLVHPICTLV